MDTEDGEKSDNDGEKSDNNGEKSDNDGEKSDNDGEKSIPSTDNSELKRLAEVSNNRVEVRDVFERAKAAGVAPEEVTQWFDEGRLAELCSPPGCLPEDAKFDSAHVAFDRIRHERSGIAYRLIPTGSLVMGDDSSQPDPGESPQHDVKTVHRVLSGGDRGHAGPVEAFDDRSPRRIRGRIEARVRDLAGSSSVHRRAEPRGPRPPPSERGRMGARVPRQSTVQVFQRQYVPPGVGAALAKRGGQLARARREFSLPNLFGLHDMNGNVWEWCEDRYHDNYDGAPVDGSAWLAGTQGFRVARGGSFDDPASRGTCASRLGHSESEKPDPTRIGFRPALDLSL